MGLCRLSDITTINMSQSCVKLYECTKFGTNIVGETCTNSVTWFCAYLCKRVKTQWTMHVVISDVQHAAFYYLCQQISPKVLKVLSFAFNLYLSIVHILKTRLVSMYHQLYFLPPLSCFHAHLLALSHINIKWYWYRDQFFFQIKFVRIRFKLISIVLQKSMQIVITDRAVPTTV